MKTFIKLLALVLALLALTLSTCAAERRTDKPFITGYDGFEFRPDNNMTRAEACAVITRLLVNEKTLDNSKSTAFTDLNKNAWYYKYVTYLESIGYLKSYSGEFKPDQKITRAEFVELVYNMGKISGGDKVVSFKDVPQTHPRYNVIMAAAKAGLVNGKSADTFDPDGDIKRSEVVKVLCVALGRNVDKSSFKGIPVAGFCDVSNDHWAYAYVLESAFEHECTADKSGVEKWISVKDKNNYFLEAPDGLIEKLEAMFEERKNEVLATKSEWTVAKDGKVWYVSYSEGENSNDGLSPETPLKTYAKIHRMQDAEQIKAGDVVLFKRGDEWHGNFICKAGVTYSAYGEGPKPRLLGSTEADSPSLWKETEYAGVYQYALTISSSRDVGNIVFDEGEYYGMRIMKSPSEDITLHTGDGGLVGNGKATWMFPVQKFTGYADIARIAKEQPESDLMYYHDHAHSKLYLYSREGNPGDRFDSIDLCVYGHGIRATSDVTIDNLCVKYAGSHGISSSSCRNLTVRNCEIGFVGGCLQGATTLSSTTRYGNAVEIYGAADGYYVYNNYIYQCFDCGPTVQWQGTPSGVMVEKNVFFYDNVIRDGSLEVWLSTNAQPTANSYARLENCRMFNNLVTGSGTGFKSGNHQKQEWCAFYGGPQTNAYYIDCYMENNYFWGNRRHLMKAVPTSAMGYYGGANGFIWRGNVIVHPGNSGSIGYLGNDSAMASGKPVQYFYDKDTVNSLVKNGTFAANKFYYTPGNASDRRVAGGMYS